MYREFFQKEVPHNGIKETEGSVLNMVAACFETYAPRPCLGYRPKDVDGNLEEEYTWLTYADIDMKTMSICKGMATLGVGTGGSNDSKVNQEQGTNIVCVWGGSSLEWFLCYYAMLRSGITVVPMHHTGSVDYVVHVSYND